MLQGKSYQLSKPSHNPANAAPHFDAASAFAADRLDALQMRLDRPVVLVGLMGVGKSTVGRKIANLLKFPFVDVDSEIEQVTRMTIAENFSRFGEASFRDGERRVIARLMDGARKVIATGGGAFVDASTRALVLDKGIAIWLDSDVNVLLERVGKRSNRPLLQGGDPRETLLRLAKERAPAYSQAPIRIVTGDQPQAETVAKCIAALESYL